MSYNQRSIHKDKHTQQLLNKYFKGKVRDVEEKFLLNLMKHFDRPHFMTDNGDDNQFKKNLKSAFPDMCLYLAIKESRFYNRRADLLSRYHPLAMQVNLSTGVANGILVARTYPDCIDLVKKLLTNTLEFSIIYKCREDPKDLHLLKQLSVTVLEETVSKCPYRIVTGDEKITNSFWNFYLRPGG